MTLPLHSPLHSPLRSPLHSAIEWKWGGGPEVRLSSTSVNETASIADLVGVLSVVNLGILTVSSYAITADPDSKFVLDGVDNTRLELEATVDYSTKTAHSVTIQATLSDASTVSRTFSIAVIDSVAPTLSSAVPADNATGVAVGASPVLTFSENIFFNYPGGGTFDIRVAGGAVVETFTPTSTSAATGSAGGSASITTTALTINPFANLSNATEYAIRIAANCLEDDAGNAYAGIANDTTLSFTSGGVGDAILDTLQTETDGLVIDGLLTRTLVRTATVDVASTPAALLTYTAPSAKYITTVAGVLTTASTIRTDHTAAGVPLGILIEEARTNICLRSEELGNAYWTPAAAAIATDNTTAPDGATTAEKLTASAGAAAHQLYVTSGVTVVSGSTYSYSVYAKKGTHRYITITAPVSANNWFGAVFDLDSGTTAATQTSTGASSGTIVSTSMADAGSGWFRLTVTGSVTGTLVYFAFKMVNAATGVTFDTLGDFSWTAAGTETVFLWGAQLELGAFPTSYIKTTTATVARAKDNISLATSSFPWSATAGYVLSSANTKALGGAGWAITDGTTNERFQSNMGTVTHFFVADGNVAQIGASGLDAGTVAVNVTSKIAAAWAVNDFAVSLDGGAAVTDVSGTLPTVTSLSLGSVFNLDTTHLNGHIGYLKYVPRRVSDANLVTESTA
jgi:hypothetical protein